MERRNAGLALSLQRADKEIFMYLHCEKRSNCTAESCPCPRKKIQQSFLSQLKEKPHTCSPSCTYQSLAILIEKGEMKKDDGNETSVQKRG
uniref:Uncharacterized protein n=1 Tax=Oryzias latipes TaxID=8090 RepID=A0A3P9JT18_ORYLA